MTQDTTGRNFVPKPDLTRYGIEWRRDNGYEFVDAGLLEEEYREEEYLEEEQIE